MAFGFQAFSPPHSILNPVNKKTDQSLSDFQIGICVAISTTLDTGQVISNDKTAVVYVIASLQDPDREIIPV